MDKLIFDTESIWGIPEMLDTPIEVKDLIPFNYCRSTPGDRPETVHFFLDDYQIERIWNNPFQYVAMLKRFNGAVSPDFSVWTDMPRALQCFNVYRSRFIGRYLQDNGIPCIPTINWADEESFEFCFVGVPAGTQVAVSSMSALKENPEGFKSGFGEMMKRLKPRQIVYYGNRVPGIDDARIVYHNPFFGRFENGRTRRK